MAELINEVKKTFADDFTEEQLEEIINDILCGESFDAAIQSQFI